MFIEINDNVYNVVNIQSLVKSQDDNKYYITYIIKNGSSITEEFDDESSRNSKYEAAASAGGGGSSDLDWTAIGYSGTPQSIIYGYNYAKQIYDNWDDTVTNLYNKFVNDNNIIFMPLVNTENVNAMNYMFSNSYTIQNVPSLNTKNVTDVSYMFSNCKGLICIDELDFSSCNQLQSFLNTAANVQYLGGFKDLGKAYKTTQSENYNRYTLNLQNCILLTHDSLMNVINKLYDIKTKGCNNQSLVLGSTNLAKLTAEEISIATNKGWNVS